MKKKRLVIYFCICLALSILIGISLFYIRKLNALEIFNREVDHSYEVIIQTNQLEKKLLNAEAGQRGFLLTQDPEFLESYLAEIKDIPDIFLKLDYLTSDNYRQQKNLDTLQGVINEQLSFLKSNIGGDFDDTLALSQFNKSNMHMNKIRDVIDNMKKSEAYRLAERNIDKVRNTRDSRQSSFLSLVIAFALVCIAAITIIWFFNKNEIYRQELEDKLHKLTELNGEIKELTIASAHNLQEPMRKVQIIIDRLQHMAGAANPAMDEQLNKVKEIYNKQQVTNNTIINYYDILSGDAKKENVDLAALVLALQTKNNWQHTFALHMKPLAAVEANAAHMALLFEKIIDNSIRFRHPDRPLEIHIGEASDAESPVTKNNAYYAIAISDNGTGVEQQYLTKIFGLFQKLEETGDLAQSGMGLSFGKRIMKNHNGLISATQNSPYGLNVILFFPKRGKA